MHLKFFFCEHCKKIISIVKDSSIPTNCCGYPMKELVSSEKNASRIREGYIPIIKIFGNDISVTVGSKLSASENSNFIEWILLESDKGVQEKWLQTGNAPHMDFAIMTGEKIQVSYEICNKKNVRISNSSLTRLEGDIRTIEGIWNLF